jgi:hypothetical protein
MDILKVSKTIKAPLTYVYSWCTDYSQDDPKLTGSKSQRIILEKTKKRAVYVQIYNGMDGKQKVAVDMVSLRPPDSWHLDYFGEEDDETGEYRLKSLGKEKTRLDMVFKEKWKAVARVPSIEEQTRSTSEAWDRYVVALEKDYNSERKPASKRKGGQDTARR